MSEPILYTATWRPVMVSAGYRCQCTGQCGAAHKKAGGRCPREHDQHASRHRGPIHLIAAPADLLTPLLAQAALGPAELRAWCPDCHDGARRAAQRTTRTTSNPDQGELFDQRDLFGL
ncbi:hypothetical protein [Streptomyces buecherae]|uniref:hypothetical protein n=1 Tax=Streptomyces buecherae TaxID=2763006 RepID=UPI00365234B0